MNHPKFVLMYDRTNVEYPYLIMEYTTSMGGVAGREHSRWMNYEAAMREMSTLSTGPVTLALSAQPADNVHQI